MDEKAIAAVQACIGSAVLTAMAGGLGLSTWSEVLTVFVVFAVAIYFTIRFAQSN